jgi:hypothetical protein
MILLACLFALNLHPLLLALSPGHFPLSDKFGEIAKLRTSIPDPFYVSNNVSNSAPYSVFESQDSDGTRNIFVTFPPFHWATPRRLSSITSDLFWKQPENHRHFRDSLLPVSGHVQVFNNSELLSRFFCNGNETHYLNYDSPITGPCSDPKHDVVMYVTCHEIDFFQHFLDNGVPHISLMEFATGLDPSQITFAMDKWASESIPYYLTRHGFKSILSREPRICARTLILPKIVPVLHPLLTRNFLDRLRLNHSVRDRVILVSRTVGDGTQDSRLVLNQATLEAKLREVYGTQFTVFHAGPDKEDQAIELFQRARIIIGSHGGAMYHAMWAGRSAKVVELVPVEETGLYPGMPDINGPPPFAHLAIYTNAMMIGQRFYRWYQPSSSLNFDVRIGEFLAWLAGVEADTSEMEE